MQTHIGDGSHRHKISFDSNSAKHFLSMKDYQRFKYEALKARTACWYTGPVVSIRSELSYLPGWHRFWTHSHSYIHKLFWYKSQWWWWWCYHMMMLLLLMMMMMMRRRRRRRIGGRVVATTHTCWLATAGGTPHRARTLWSVRMAMDCCMQSAICKHNGASIYIYIYFVYKPPNLMVPPE